WRITPHLVDRLQLNELKVAFFLLGKSRKIKIKIMNEYIGFRHSIFRGSLHVRIPQLFNKFIIFSPI
ncbi:MAG: hypothetical protein Q8O72_04320, partial [Bacteroidales bacterium]|nr:hypothetical protein [Bacteroidales bacterium]